MNKSFQSSCMSICLKGTDCFCTHTFSWCGQKWFVASFCFHQNLLSIEIHPQLLPIHAVLGRESACMELWHSSKFSVEKPSCALLVWGNLVKEALIWSQLCAPMFVFAFQRFTVHNHQVGQAVLLVLLWFCQSTSSWTVQEYTSDMHLALFDFLGLNFEFHVHGGKGKDQNPNMF